MFRAVCLLVILATLAWSALVGATGPAYLVKDIVPTRCTYDLNLPYVSCDSHPRELVALGSTLYFEAVDQSSVWHLWRSDGTTEGTMQVGDVVVHAGYEPFSLVAANGSLFFFGHLEAGTSGLWKSDGTAGGTTPVKGLPPLYYPALHVLAGKVFITSLGPQLWTTDGTAEGTTELVDFSGRLASDSWRWLLGERATETFFSFCEQGGNCELWKTDGTSPGTVRVAVMVPPYQPADQEDDPAASVYSFANAGGTLFFSVCQYPFDCDLWRTDGTTEGTLRVAQRPQSMYQDRSWGPIRLAPLGGSVLFTDCESGCQLWSSDGTTEGTGQFAPIALQGQSFSYEPPNFTPVGDDVLLLMTDNEEAWRTDGTLTGTFALGNGIGLNNPVSIEGMAYFTGRYQWDGVGVYESDGTVAGTFLLAQPRSDWLPGWGGDPHFTVAGRRLFFNAFDPVHGEELWAIPLDGDSPARCGDGQVDPGEECDDGNSTDGDGCDGACRLEPPATTTTTSSTSSTMPAAISTTTTSTTSTAPPHPTPTVPVCHITGCDDGDPCTVDGCDALRGCVSEPDPAPGSACLIKRAADTAACAPQRLALRLVGQVQRAVGCLGPCSQCRGPAGDALLTFRHTVGASLRAHLLQPDCAARLRMLVAHPCVPSRVRRSRR